MTLQLKVESGFGLIREFQTSLIQLSFSHPKIHCDILQLSNLNVSKDGLTFVRFLEACH